MGAVDTLLPSSLDGQWQRLFECSVILAVAVADDIEGQCRSRRGIVNILRERELKR